MKFILSALCAIVVLSSSHASAVDSAQIWKSAATLGSVFGFRTIKVKSGATARQMVQWFAKAQFDIEAGKVVNNKVGVSFGDEVTVGTTSMAEATQLVDASRDFYLESIPDLAEEYANAEQAIKDLRGTGVVFGYTGFGPGFCGVSFATLLLIDTEKKQIYEIYLSKSDPC